MEGVEIRRARFIQRESSVMSVWLFGPACELRRNAAPPCQSLIQ